MAERKYQFERLTPIDNMDLDVYGEAIDYVFDNSDIKNVAISGAYSAGKSSVLASYKKKHSNLRFLHISLAHFKSPGQEDEAEVKESVLEGKILNQLIHQIPSEKIPQTNFRVKKKVNNPFETDPQLHSTKKSDGKRHGYGLTNICAIAEKYNGCMQTEYSSGSFISSVSLCCKPLDT